jgi:hypothetical protein
MKLARMRHLLTVVVLTDHAGKTRRLGLTTGEILPYFWAFFGRATGYFGNGKPA